MSAGQGRVARGRRPRPRWATPSATCEKAVGGATRTSSRCWRKASSPRQELDRAASRPWPAPARSWSWPKRRRDALVRFGRPLELSQAEARGLADARERCASSRRPRPTAWSRSARPSPRRRAASPEATAQARAWRSSSSHAPRCAPTCPASSSTSDVFFGSEQRKPQVGDQVWANQPLADPARHLQDGGGDEGARDGHPQGREEPERHRARRGLPGPAALGHGHAGGHAGPGREGTARGQVLRASPSRSTSRSRGCGRA